MPTPDELDRLICEGKISYTKYRTAEKSAKRLRRKFEKYRYDVYNCRFCQAWHVGRTEGKVKKQ